MLQGAPGLPSNAIIALPPIPGPPHVHVVLAAHTRFHIHKRASLLGRPVVEILDARCLAVINYVNLPGELVLDDGLVLKIYTSDWVATISSASSSLSSMLMTPPFWVGASGFVVGVK